MNNLSHHKMEYTDKTRNVDNMIEQLTIDKQKVTSMLETNVNTLVDKIWTHESPIYKDDQCLFQMGKTVSELEEVIDISKNLRNFELYNEFLKESMSNFYVCSQCKNMKRLIDFTLQKLDVPFYIECGERV